MNYYLVQAWQYAFSVESDGYRKMSEREVFSMAAAAAYPLKSPEKQNLECSIMGYN